MQRRRSASFYRTRQDAHIRHLVDTQTPAEREAHARTVGGWHEETCKDCGTTLPARWRMVPVQ